MVDVRAVHAEPDPGQYPEMFQTLPFGMTFIPIVKSHEFTSPIVELGSKRPPEVRTSRGPIDSPIRTVADMAKRTCTIDGCEDKAIARGWCPKHYQRWNKHGDPTVVRPAYRPPSMDPWKRIDQSGGPDACWPWTGRRDDQGYGLAKISQRQWRIARWVLIQKLGHDLDPDEVTRHTCDNPPCCNPAHLLAGAPVDNSRDMVERGRSLAGDRHWTRRQPGLLAGSRNAAARLTESDVRSIRDRYAVGGVRQVDLAAEFGVTQGLISQIIRRAAWAHLE